MFIDLLHNFTQLLLVTTLLGNIALAFIVFRNNPKSATNIIFIFLSFITSIWLILINLSTTQLSPYYNLIYTRLTVFFAVPQSVLFFLLAYTIPSSTLILKKKYFYSIILGMILIMVLTLSPYVFKEVQVVGTNIKSIPGPGIILFAIFTSFFSIGAVYVLIKKFKNSKDQIRQQLRLIINGILLILGLIITTIMIPVILFENQMFIPFAPLYALIFLALTAYAIIKHHLFNIKIVITEAITFILWIILFAKIFNADSLVNIITDSLIFIVIFIFGILLVRSVMKEVEQREEIAKMAQELERAYVVEKKAKEELEKLDKFKDQFLMTTQHNLRTPLTSMMGYSDLILKGMFGKQNKKTTEVIQKFQSLVQGMIKMVNDFLDMAQFQLGRDVVALRPNINLEPILDEIINELEFKATSRNLYLKLEKPEKIFTINADREKLKAALFNIVDNAVKYTEKGGVDIKVHPVKSASQSEAVPSGAGQFNGVKNHDTVKIIISDTGIGIPKEKLANIFNQMFERTEEAKRVSSIGSGIGLYLSGQIIKSHHGKVWVESEGEGKGSTFYIELPISKEPVISNQEPVTNEQPVTSNR